VAGVEPIIVSFENWFRGDNIGTGYTIADSSGQFTQAQIETLARWRFYPQLTWTFGAPTGSFDLRIGSFSANLTGDVLVVANHNLTLAGEWTQVNAIYFDGATWIGDGSSAFPLTDPVPDPLLIPFTSAAGTRSGWGIRFVSNTGSTPDDLKIGSLLIGRRETSFSSFATPPDFDPYSMAVKGDGGGTPHGSPIGTKARSVKRNVTLHYPGPGVAGGELSGQDPTFVDMRDHMITGLPVWFAWNTTEDRHDVFIARTSSVRIPSHGSLKRYSPQIDLELLDYVSGVL